MKNKMKMSVIGLMILLSLSYILILSSKSYKRAFYHSLPVSSRYIGPPKGCIDGYLMPSAFKKLWRKPSTESYRFLLLDPEPHFADLILQRPEVALYQLQSSRVCGEIGAVITSQDDFLRQSVLFYVSKSKPEWKSLLFNHSKLPKIKKIAGTVAVITTPGANCYYHWMIDWIPKAMMLKPYFREIDTFYITKPETSFQKETLELLGIPLERCIFATNKTQIEADCVLYPFYAGFCLDEKGVHHHLPDKLGCELTRELFPTDKQVEANRLLYISRRHSMRPLQNEDLLVAALEKLGFEEIFFERMSIKAQAELIQSAKIVIAPHGAGLTNLLFCRPGTQVLELRLPMINPELMADACYSQLCDEMQLDYHYIMTTTSNPDEVSWLKRHYRVDIAEVESKVQSMATRCKLMMKIDS